MEKNQKKARLVRITLKKNYEGELAQLDNKTYQKTSIEVC